MALGMSLEQLIDIYRIQFPVMQQYEIDTWYDQNGRIVFSAKSIGDLTYKRTEFERSIKDAPAGQKFYRTITDDMGDVYEVAGQAVKSITWLTTKGRFAEKVSSRHAAGHCIPVQGDFRECIRALRDAGKLLTAFIVIVQPSLSRSVAMPSKIQEVLASASTYIKRAGKVQGLEIIGSK